MDREEQINILATKDDSEHTELSRLEIKLIASLSDTASSVVRLEHNSPQTIKSLAETIVVLREYIITIDTDKLDKAIENILVTRCSK